MNEIINKKNKESDELNKMFKERNQTFNNLKLIKKYLSNKNNNLEKEIKRKAEDFNKKLNGEITNFENQKKYYWIYIRISIIVILFLSTCLGSYTVNNSNKKYYY